MKGSTTTSPRFEIGIEEGAFQVLWMRILQPTRVCGSSIGKRSGFGCKCCVLKFADSRALCKHDFRMQMLRFGICGLEGLVYVCLFKHDFKIEGQGSGVEDWDFTRDQGGAESEWRQKGLSISQLGL